MKITETFDTLTAANLREVSPIKVSDVYNRCPDEIMSGIVKKIAVKDSLVDMEVVVVENPKTVEAKCYYVFKINGKEFTGSFLVDLSARKLSDREVINFAHDKFKEQLAVMLTYEFDYAVFDYRMNINRKQE